MTLKCWAVPCLYLALNILTRPAFYSIQYRPLNTKREFAWDLD